MQHRAHRAVKIIKLAGQAWLIMLTDKKHGAFRVKRLLFDTFTSLGGVYIKFLQILASNREFMQGWSGPADLRVFEGVPTESIDIHALLQKELGKDKLQSFRYVAAEPFAAGSFAQVYKAEFHNGDTLAIKVLRPSLANSLQTDLRLIGSLVRLLHSIKPINMVDTLDLFQEFSQSTRQETNYTKELANMQWFAENVFYSDSIVTPKPHTDYCTKHVLTQNYIGGLSLAEILTNTSNTAEAHQYVYSKLRSNIHTQLTILGSELIHETIWSQYMFGDPHPGNIRLLPDNKIGILDFGIIGKTPPNKRGLFEVLANYKTLYDGTFNAGAFLLSVMQLIDEKLAYSLSALEEMFGRTGRISSGIVQITNETFLKSAQTTAGNSLVMNKRITRIFSSLINKNNKYGIQLDGDSTSFVKSVSSYVQLLRSCTTEQQSQSILGSILRQEYSFCLSHYASLPEYQTLIQPDYDDALEIADEWLSQIADKDPWLFALIRDSLRRRYYA